jgi:hypothetical protein
VARPAGPPTTPKRSATATLVLPGFAETTPPAPPGRTLPQMQAHPDPVSTPAPTAALTATAASALAPSAPADGAQPRRVRRRAISLVVMLGFGVVGGGAAAVLEDVLAPTRAQALAPRAVVRALHPLGTQLMASRAFETDVTDSAGFGGLGEEVTYHGAGTVSASIDFTQLEAHDVHVIAADDRPRVRVRLLDVELGAPVLDGANSGVVERQSGIFYFLFGDTVSENELRREALDELAATAEASTLTAQARGAAVAEVRSRIVGLGAKAVQVDFVSSGPGRDADRALAR